jgi:hypothetical protein
MVLAPPGAEGRLARVIVQHGWAWPASAVRTGRAWRAAHAHLLEKVTSATFPQVDYDRMIARNVPKRMTPLLRPPQERAERYAQGSSSDPRQEPFPCPSLTLAAAICLFVAKVYGHGSFHCRNR